ncbi:MAG: S4 domain-containing protein, partial [Ignavibacteriaceae bacterium]
MSRIIKEKKYRFEVPEGKQKERIDTFLTNAIENATRSKVQKLIDADLVTVNGKIVKANYQVKPLDIIEAVQPISPRPEDVEPENIPLDIVYEDEYLIVVNKPAGMVAHPAYANYTGTLRTGHRAPASGAPVFAIATGAGRWRRRGIR